MGKHDQRFDAGIGRHAGSERAVQELFGFGHRCGCQRLVEQRVAVFHHAQHIGHAKAVGFTDGAVSGAVKALGNAIHCQIALPVPVVIAGNGEMVIQHIGQAPERSIILFVGVNCRVFVDQIHGGAMILAHGQPGQGKGIVVTLDRLLQIVDIAILRTVGRDLVITLGGRLVNQRLHDPDQTHAVEIGPEAGGGIAHLPAKGDALPALLVGEQRQRHIDRFVGAIGGLVVDRDVVGGQLGLGWQVGAVGGEAQFKHRHELQVAIGFVGAGDASAGGGNIGKGFVVNILHLPLVIKGPIQHILGKLQMVGVLRAQLKFHNGWLARGQIVELDLQRIGLSIGEAAFAKGREVFAVRHAVAVVVLVKKVGGVVAVAVERGGAQGAIRVEAPLNAIALAIFVAVDGIRVEIPLLPPQGKASHLDIVAQAIAVGVGHHRAAADAHLLQVGQRIAVAVGFGQALAGAAGGVDALHLRHGQSALIEGRLVDQPVEVRPAHASTRARPIGGKAGAQLIFVEIVIGRLRQRAAANADAIQIDRLGCTIIDHGQMAEGVVVDRPGAGRGVDRAPPEHLHAQAAVRSHIDGWHMANRGCRIGRHGPLLLPQDHAAGGGFEPEFKAKGRYAVEGGGGDGEDVVGQGDIAIAAGKGKGLPHLPLGKGHSAV